MHDIYILRIKSAKVSQQESRSFGSFAAWKHQETLRVKGVDARLSVCVSPVMNWWLVVWATPSLSPAGIDSRTPATLSAGELVIENA